MKDLGTGPVKMRIPKQNTLTPGRSPLSNSPHVRARRHCSVVLVILVTLSPRSCRVADLAKLSEVHSEFHDRHSPRMSQNVCSGHGLCPLRQLLLVLFEIAVIAGCVTVQNGLHPWRGF